MRFQALWLACTVLVGFLVASCQKSSDTKDSYRLAATELIARSGEAAWRLRIGTTTNTASSIFVGRDRASWHHMVDSDDDTRFEREILILGSQLDYHDQRFVKSIVGMGSVTRKVDKDVALEDVLSVTVSDGTYPLDKPLVVGQLDGEDIKLVVGATAVSGQPASGE